ncbi:MAG: hypothetical protein ACKODE_08775, partial [Acidimicrobiaceae bacterium]
ALDKNLTIGSKVSVTLVDGRSTQLTVAGTCLTIEPSPFTVSTAKNVSVARVKCVLRIMVKQIECSTGVLTAKFATLAQVQVGM